MKWEGSERPVYCFLCPVIARARVEACSLRCAALNRLAAHSLAPPILNPVSRLMEITEISLTMRIFPINRSSFSGRAVFFVAFGIYPRSLPDLNELRLFRYHATSQGMVMDREIASYVERFGVSPVRAAQILRDRRDILRRSPLRSVNWLK